MYVIAKLFVDGLIRAELSSKCSLPVLLSLDLFVDFGNLLTTLLNLSLFIARRPHYVFVEASL